MYNKFSILNLFIIFVSFFCLSFNLKAEQANETYEIQTSIDATKNNSKIEKAKQLFSKGVDFYNQGKLHDALGMFLKAHKIYSHPFMVYNIARTYERLGDDVEAITYYNNYLKIKQDITEDEMIKINKKISSLEEHRKNIELSLKAEPPTKEKLLKGARTFYLRGVKLYNKGYYQPAYEAFQAAYNISPFPDLLYNMALTAEKLTQIDVAVDLYQRYMYEIQAKEIRQKIRVHIEELRQQKKSN